MPDAVNIRQDFTAIKTNGLILVFIYIKKKLIFDFEEQIDYNCDYYTSATVLYTHL